MAKEATLKIGNSFVDSKGAVMGVATAIEMVFKSGFDNRMEQETVKKALETLGQIARIENVTVTNSVFKGDKTVNMGEEDDEDKED